MRLEKLTPKDIEKLSYNEIIGIIKETNRPPGGKNSIFEIMNRCFINQNSKILEVGTSTGFTALEISKLVRCKIVSIDINENSLNEAKKRASFEGFDNISFVRADVNNLPFKDMSFDLVIVGNVFSLMKKKEKTLKECLRVCKKSGFIAAIPMYYLTKPSKKLVNEVSNAIGIKITPLYKRNWNDFFSTPQINIYWDKDYKFDYIKNKEIDNFVKEILSREHLKRLKKESMNLLTKKYKNYMLLFRDNLSKMGFSIILLERNKIWEDKELFTSKEITNK